ncbi:TRAP transporter small permease [Alkalihalobacillus sp. MEB130]|uniref:TRAP transporter small permease n=1 Tax=Alkalihalobacillus sp. MEB130 TaxID=2976704 RepID=UPI0028DEE807|nr:TRAP transporter small permease [Alkalihalobacillus sp. MEB130]MDT8861008.1 TRAP transporter small permease [Alkalihalobacillus sp. MEB130]
MIVLRSYLKCIEIINKIASYTIAIMLGLMVIFISMQVYARFVSGQSLAWSEEASRFLMVWLILLGTGIASKRGELMAVEILPDSVSLKLQKLIKVVVHCISILFFSILVFYGWELAKGVAIQTAPGIGISMFWAYVSVPVGAIFVILNTINSIIKIFVEVGDT